MPPASRDATMQVEALELFDGEDFEDIVDDPLGECGSDMDAQSDEDLCISGEVDPETVRFDATVGALEDLLVSDEFQGTIADFCREHAGLFEDTEENKVEYWPIFQQYSALIEQFVERNLAERVEDFSMPAFVQQLTARKDEVNEEIFDTLLSMGEFEHFKGQMLEYKAARSSVDLSLTGRKARVHTDEMEDGEARPDLELLAPSPYTPTKKAVSKLADLSL